MATLNRVGGTTRSRSYELVVVTTLFKMQLTELFRLIPKDDEEFEWLQHLVINLLSKNDKVSVLQHFAESLNLQAYISNSNSWYRGGLRLSVYWPL